MKTIRRIMTATVLFVLLAAMASAQGLPKAKTPEQVGLLSERLKSHTFQIPEKLFQF